MEGEYITLNRSSYDQLKLSNDEIKAQVRNDFFALLILEQVEFETKNGQTNLVTLSHEQLKEEFANHLGYDSAKVEIQIRDESEEA
ncbi:TPA: hypothetical protein ACHR8U_002956 [Listeria monocytogenes]|uniref:hypothetical protein n=1 Tax=Listeria monocytogenes TaxID=1639 RepID=UPI00148B9AB2|nr:hypothetical protein [Listeria monocytogenes]EGO5453278.1 hypothetical protein [Listeria monocytogenes]EHX3186505.1 hypothetical protein [Listeria monocytogenes]QJW60481.1 hypothetical protein HNT73_10875 [Listeria monocytogenes]HAA3078599.1 hypothetical protein [Listeria monocytogenes]HAB0715350.1 hypothetical protein [Listeria monocytogenes]